MLFNLQRKLLFYSRIFKETVAIYRRAVDFFINVCLAEWDTFSDVPGYVLQMQDVERMCHQTSGRPCVKYDTFD
ncbi:MAG: hypothetical protein IJT60_05635, partial [Clostridia bacterium]|nr:hypothetical protein [Clostridia bacterium]